MDYEKKLALAKEALDSGSYDKETIEYIFPELAESEDERIKKEILELVSISGNGNQFEEIKDWLEKQGEKKSTDKVEPKFKVGDWVVINGFVLKILRACNDLYETTFLQSGELRIYDTYVLDNSAHLWTIRDAKDGDVLVASDGSLFIFAKVKDNSAYFHFSLCKDGSKEISNGNLAWETSNNCHPATKEQRDLLFAKMKEAGYEWDAEKKELRKIENSPLLSNSLNIGKDEQKPEWTEEDECYMGECISAIATKDGWSFEEKRKTKQWLKSLKKRMEEQ